MKEYYEIIIYMFLKNRDSLEKIGVYDITNSHCYKPKSAIMITVFKISFKNLINISNKMLN